MLDARPPGRRADPGALSLIQASTTPDSGDPLLLGVRAGRVRNRRRVLASHSPASDRGAAWVHRAGRWPRVPASRRSRTATSAIGEWRPALGYAARRLHSILWVTFLGGFLALLGLILLIIPGVYLYISFAVAIPVLLTEGLKGRHALGRSRQLVKGRFWPTFGVVVLGAILVGIVQGALAGLAGAASFSEGPDTLASYTAQTIATVVGSLIATPLTAAFITVLYFDLRVRKEAFDLQLLAQQIGVDPGPGSVVRHRSATRICSTAPTSSRTSSRHSGRRRPAGSHAEARTSESTRRRARGTFPPRCSVRVGQRCDRRRSAGPGRASGRRPGGAAAVARDRSRRRTAGRSPRGAGRGTGRRARAAPRGARGSGHSFPRSRRRGTGPRRQRSWTVRRTSRPVRRVRFAGSSTGWAAGSSRSGVRSNGSPTGFRAAVTPSSWYSARSSCSRRRSWPRGSEPSSAASSSSGSAAARAVRRSIPHGSSSSRRRRRSAASSRLALRLRFRAGLARLAALHTVPQPENLTSRQLARALGSPRFGGLARDLDEVVYGGRQASAADLTSAREGWPQVLREARRP